MAAHEVAHVLDHAEQRDVELAEHADGLLHVRDALEGLTLQTPADRYRCHYVKTTVRVHRYSDGSLDLFHGPRKLADYNPNGSLTTRRKEAAS